MLISGPVSLEEYVTKPIGIEEARKRTLDIQARIREIEQVGVLPAERGILQRLFGIKTQIPIQAVYPELDPSFLSMANQVDRQGISFSLPRFSVYPVFGNPEFTLTMEHQPRHRGSCYSGEYNVTVDRLLPKMFSDNLVKATSVWKSFADKRIVLKYQALGDNRYQFDNPHCNCSEQATNPCPIFEHYQEFKFDSRLDILVPQEVKKRISGLRRNFGKKGLYFIAETEPGEWNVTATKPAPKIDPLVVGVIGDRCYLVDKFDMTAMEEYVMREFRR